MARYLVFRLGSAPFYVEVGSIFYFHFSYSLLNLVRNSIVKLMERRSYSVNMLVNQRPVTEVVIDSHYELNHPDMSDELILKLVLKLNGREFTPVDRKDDFDFFVADHLLLQRKIYRLVWCMKDDRMYIGVINAFRRK